MNNLKTGLQPRHVQMIAIGGMIGTGVFKGSSDTISLAGPGVTVAYLFGGLLLLIIMSALADMARTFPGLDIRGMIGKAFGPKASFIMGWLYWINWILVTAVEIVAAGSFLQFWFPTLPLWILSLVVAIGLVMINLTSVKNYGELEFWLACVKVATLIVFIVLGAFLLMKGTSGQADLWKNYTSHQGFFPKGWSGISSALLVVLFSYGGAELIGLTITETKDAQRVLPKIIKGVLWRVIVFYTLPLFIICGLVPWDEVSNHTSPFVQVLASVGLNHASQVMNFVMLTAVCSAANSGLYATSRMLYSLAKAKQAPTLFSRLSNQGVPVYSLMISVIGLFFGVLMAYLTPDHVFSILMGIPGFVVLLFWIGIALAHGKLRYRKSSSYVSVLGALILFVILVKILMDASHLITSLVCVSIVILLFIFSLWEKKYVGSWATQDSIKEVI